MASKKIRIEFYKSQMESEIGGEKLISSALNRILKNERGIQEDFSSIFQVRNLSSNKKGSLFYGFFGKFRIDDHPHIASLREKEERPIDMEDDEGLIEKNHFIFCCDRNILAYQTNKNGAGAHGLAKFITTIVEQKIIFVPVIDAESVKKLMLGNGEVKSVEFSFACAGPSDLIGKTTPFSDDLVKSLSKTGGEKMRIKITPPRGKFLKRDVKTFAQDLMESIAETRLAKLEIEDDSGMIHPVDLVASRVYKFKYVEMSGKYPVFDDMIAKLKEALTENFSLERAT